MDQALSSPVLLTWLTAVPVPRGIGIGSADTQQLSEMKNMLADRARAGTVDGRLLVLAAAVLWGTTGTTQALAPAAAHPLVVGTLRMVIGALGLTAIALASRRQARGVGDARWPVGVIIAAGLVIAAYQLLFFSGVARTGVAVGTIAGIGSTPIFAGLLELGLDRRPPGRRWLAATLLALAGNAVLLSQDGRGMVVEAVGVLLALGAGFAYALFVWLSKRVLRAGFAPVPATAAMFAAGGVALAPILFVFDTAWIATLPGGVVAAHLGLVATVLAYVCFANGLRTTGVATAATLTLAEPLTAGLLGVMVLGEALSAPAGVGIGLIVAGLIVLAGERGEAPQ